MKRGPRSEVATAVFNVPDDRVISGSLPTDGRGQVIVETDESPGCRSCVSRIRGGRIAPFKDP